MKWVLIFLCSICFTHLASAQVNVKRQFHKFWKGEKKKVTFKIEDKGLESGQYYFIDTASKKLIRYEVLIKSLPLHYRYFIRNDSLIYIMVIDKGRFNKSGFALYYYQNNKVKGIIEENMDSRNLLDFVSESNKAINVGLLLFKDAWAKWKKGKSHGHGN
ncbi:MAG TPA: hypothetical protein VHK91_09110 [Flavisolibacter sp.]|jgi:hypothetical protein|nr:hypothetical protein [Flavisolibacter sp.]